MTIASMTIATALTNYAVQAVRAAADFAPTSDAVLCVQQMFCTLHESFEMSLMVRSCA